MSLKGTEGRAPGPIVCRGKEWGRVGERRWSVSSRQAVDSVIVDSCEEDAWSGEDEEIVDGSKERTPIGGDIGSRFTRERRDQRMASAALRKAWS